jgi:hypothetical protein
MTLKCRKRRIKRNIMNRNDEHYKAFSYRWRALPGVYALVRLRASGHYKYGRLSQQERG